ncbi:MAG: restriction endonuclease [Phycisphaerales bacterium]
MTNTNTAFDNADRLWVVHISNNKRLAERAQREGFMCIGWTRIGDLRPYDTPEKLKAAYERAFPNKSAASVRSSYTQVYKFAHEMEVGEPVVYPIKGSSDVMIGRIAGPYEWSDDPELREGDYNNVREVEWLERVPRVRFSQGALRSFASYSSVSTADDHLDEVRRVLAGRETPSMPTSSGELPVTDDEAEESEDDAEMAAEEVIQRTKDYLLRLWSRTKQDFEEVVATVFRALGYTATTTRGTRDLGVDIVAHADPLGVTGPILKIECKSGTSTIGAPEVKRLKGVLNPGEKGILVALGGFSIDAMSTEQNSTNLILIDADRFVDLFLSSYDRLSPEIRHRFPLQRVYVVAS